MLMVLRSIGDDADYGTNGKEVFDNGLRKPNKHWPDGRAVTLRSGFYSAFWLVTRVRLLSSLLVIVAWISIADIFLDFWVRVLQFEFFASNLYSGVS
ncbi:hypothetical protein P3T76_013707 [Phytophthora citrophthora]|uniref:Uncharacterized protein n=1 Tax=Phytophthora citrophthora TaxID=4793 RepID=A0AAD9G2V8_9STRA|nr:hypothetical protein P3T76_013707 [Phytophthora citrophthora]